MQKALPFRGYKEEWHSPNNSFMGIIILMSEFKLCLKQYLITKWPHTNNNENNIKIKTYIYKNLLEKVIEMTGKSMTVDHINSNNCKYYADTTSDI